MMSIICYTNNTRTLEHSYFTSSQLLRQDISSTTIFQSTDDILSGLFYLVCTPNYKVELFKILTLNRIMPNTKPMAV